MHKNTKKTRFLLIVTSKQLVKQLGFLIEKTTVIYFNVYLKLNHINNNSYNINSNDDCNFNNKCSNKIIIFVKVIIKQ